ncbi:Gfo/Idh/MocA family protein [Gorillibacterium sp. sgz5001074]|uniref:Gfo/Idh/MocA family protein n=1 Tax=Gorillibacterium sp. sgz5001074 TaxID=3446695 RepID=UPI003F67DCE5
MQKLKWGILGCASIAIGKVIPGMLKSETAEIAAIASRGPEKAREAAAQFGIPKAYGSYEELLSDPEVEAVYIPLPNHLHKEWTIRAAEAGKHVLCEKPLALSATEAEEMADACRQAGVVLAEAFMYRYHPQISLSKKLIEEGSVGTVRLIRGSFTFHNAADTGNVRYVKEWGGGSLFDVGCYPIHAARYLLGQEPEAVTAHGFFSEAHGGVDMVASGTLEFAGGVSLLFDCGMWAANRQSLEIVGTEGTINLPAPFLPSFDAPAVVVLRTRGEERVVEAGPANSYSLQADEFAAVVRGERQARFPASDAVANMRVVEACLRSAERRERITLA